MTQNPANPSEKPCLVSNPDLESKLGPEDLQPQPEKPVPPREIGGAKGLEPTRYGDWERNGRCTDF